MKSAETSLSTRVLKQSQPEEFDLVILGGVTGSGRTFPILLPKKLGTFRRSRVFPPGFRPVVATFQVSQTGPQIPVVSFFGLSSKSHGCRATLAEDFSTTPAVF